MSLTADQLKKIEENKRQAQLKRQNVIRCKVPTSVYQHPNSSKLENKRELSNQIVGNAKLNNLSNYHVKKSSNLVTTLNAKLKICAFDKFAVEMGYHEASIEIMKSINGRIFDKDARVWTFPLSEHDSLVSKLTALKPNVTVSPIPKNVLLNFRIPPPDVSGIQIDKIDDNLKTALLPFQSEGVKFGISRRGRCLIADDMGLGKTIQALGIAHYYVESWPLLIICPSSMRFPWEEAIHRFLPSVSPFSVLVVTSASDDVREAIVVICSYDLLKNCMVAFKQKKFGVVIFDESHFLKNMKSARTKACLEVTTRVSHVILLSGTPALSRPLELFPQIHAIDPSCFSSFYEFGLRYCDGKKNRFGWDYTGSSNTAELELFLKRKFMIRRMKCEVLQQLPSKVRKVVILHPKMVKAISKQMQALESQMTGQKGMERRGTLLQYYAATGVAKLEAVKEYIEDKLETPGKMLVFGHHTSVIDGLSDLMIHLKIEYIRIDGSTSAEARAAMCEQFQNDPNTRVAILSIRAANSGITLTAAQLVIFAELFWNPGELTQAEDRAHRIGQQDSVLVEYLLAKNTADDHLWSLVESKLKVLNSVGLSKDSFKDTNTEHLDDKLKNDITNYFQCEPDKNEISASQANAFGDDFDADAFEEDDIFDSVDLSNIEETYCSESKRIKTG